MERWLRMNLPKSLYPSSTQLRMHTTLIMRWIIQFCHLRSYRCRCTEMRVSALSQEFHATKHS